MMITPIQTPIDNLFVLQYPTQSFVKMPHLAHLILRRNRWQMPPCGSTSLASILSVPGLAFHSANCSCGV